MIFNKYSLQTAGVVPVVIQVLHLSTLQCYSSQLGEHQQVLAFPCMSREQYGTWQVGNLTLLLTFLGKPIKSYRVSLTLQKL